MRLLVPLLAAAVLLPSAPAAASCVAMPPAELERRAGVIVEGKILTARPGLATLAVERVLKGDAPAAVKLLGAGGPGVVSSVDIYPDPGERWRILGSRADGDRIATSACDGSELLGAPAPAATAEPPPAGVAALLTWLAGLLRYLAGI